MENCKKCGTCKTVSKSYLVHDDDKVCMECFEAEDGFLPVKCKKCCERIFQMIDVKRVCLVPSHGECKTVQVCKYHSFCSKCIIEDLRITVQCDFCKFFMKSKEICIGDMGLIAKEESIINPRCVSELHRYCLGCMIAYQTKEINFQCKACNSLPRESNQGNPNLCFLCGIRKINIEKCKYHGYCHQCHNQFITEYSFPSFSQILNCKNCFTYFSCKLSLYDHKPEELKEIDIEVKENIEECLVCNSTSDLVKNPSCNSHMYCESCLWKIEKFECQYCDKYRVINRNQKICKLCKTVTSVQSDNPCKSHRFCQNCIDLLDTYSVKCFKETSDCPACATFFEKFPKLLQNLSISSQSAIAIKSVPTSAQVWKKSETLMILQLSSLSIAPIQIPSKSPKIPTLPSENLSISLIPDNIGICKLCNLPGKLMECQHTFCFPCQLSNFAMFFEYFMQLLTMGYTDFLNETDTKKLFHLGCKTADCYNTLCLPFSFFKKKAYEIMLKYPIYYKKGLLEHYALFFEGFNMSFDICLNCQKFVGYLLEPKCFYCSS